VGRLGGASVPRGACLGAILAEVNRSPATGAALLITLTVAFGVAAFAGHVGQHQLGQTGGLPPMDSPLWKTVRSGIANPTTRWDTATMTRTDGVVCTRILALPRHAASVEEALRASVGTSGCTAEPWDGRGFAERIHFRCEGGICRSTTTGGGTIALNEFVAEGQVIAIQACVEWPQRPRQASKLAGQAADHDLMFVILHDHMVTSPHKVTNDCQWIRQGSFRAHLND
jgi:hypothetical protein